MERVHACQLILACGLEIHAHRKTKGTANATRFEIGAGVRFRHDIECQATLAHMTHTLRHGDTLFRDTALHKHTLRATRALARTFGVPNPMGIEGRAENRAAGTLLVLAQHPRMPVSKSIMQILRMLDFSDDGKQLNPAVVLELLSPSHIPQNIITDRDGLRMALVAPSTVALQES